MRHLNALGRLDRREVHFRIQDQYRIVTVGDLRYVALYCKENVSIPFHATHMSLMPVNIASVGRRKIRKYFSNRHRNQEGSSNNQVVASKRFGNIRQA